MVHGMRRTYASDNFSYYGILQESDRPSDVESCLYYSCL